MLALTTEEKEFMKLNTVTAKEGQLTGALTGKRGEA
jgi:hypothetical protein